MKDEMRPAYFVVCGAALGGEVDPEYTKRARPVGVRLGLKPIAGGEVGGAQLELLEGELPAGSSFLAIEQFPSMAALKEFYCSEEYQAAIPFREGSVRIDFLAAVEGIAQVELDARSQELSEKEPGPRLDNGG